MEKTSVSLFPFFTGVNVKFWNIYLKDDELEENHERLEVVLKAQKNAVLGVRSRASVEIVDPRHGIVPHACILIDFNHYNQFCVTRAMVHSFMTTKKRVLLFFLYIDILIVN